MDREIRSLIVMAFFVIVFGNIADGAVTKTVQSVFIFSHYKKIEEVSNYRILTNVYVHELPPADMMKLCTNIARSTYFFSNGYKLIRGVSPDRLRNYRVSFSRFGKRELIAAFKCPMDPPVYVQHRGKMIMVYLKKPRNFGCPENENEERSTGGRSWFHNFFRRAKRFFGVKPYNRVRSGHDFLCLGKGLGIAHSTTYVEDFGKTARSDRQHEEHFFKHTLQPWVLSRVKFGGNLLISSVDDLVNDVKHGFGGIQEGSRFYSHMRPVDGDLGGIGSGGLSGNDDVQTTIDAETSSVNDLQTHFDSKLKFDSNVHQQEFTNADGFQSGVQSKISPTLVIDHGAETTNFENHVLPDEVSSSNVKFESDVYRSDVDSRINFSKSGLKPVINLSTDGSSKSSFDFVNGELRRPENFYEVNMQPKLDTTDRIHSTESEFGSISSLPLRRS